MKVSKVCEVDACDYCGDIEVNPRNLCAWCGKLLCHLDSIIVPVRNETHTDQFHRSRVVCPECASKIFDSVLEIERQVKELEQTLDGLKCKSAAQMGEIIDRMIERNRIEYDKKYGKS